MIAAKIIFLMQFNEIKNNFSRRYVSLPFYSKLKLLEATLSGYNKVFFLYLNSINTINNF